MSMFGDKDIKHELEEIERRLDAQQSELDLILERVDEVLNTIRKLPTGGFIDILGGTMSTLAGSSSTFQFAYTPTGSVAPTGTTQSWTVDVADITLTPSPDGFTCTAAVPAGETATSYNLTCTSSFVPAGAPTPISATLNVPITVAVPLPTGGVITQTA
jgi:hypothetical protein